MITEEMADKARELRERAHDRRPLSISEMLSLSLIISGGEETLADTTVFAPNKVIPFPAKPRLVDDSFPCDSETY